MNQRFQLGCYSKRQVRALRAVVGSLISNAVSTVEERHSDELLMDVR